MKRHPISISILFILMLAALLGCRRATGGDEKKMEEQKADENWQMRDDIKEVQIGPSEEEAFRQAAHDGELERVKTLHKQGVGCNAVDQDGHSALMFAAFNGHSELVLYLLNAGAEINQDDYMGRTALLYASTGPFPETVKILLDHGADPNKVDSDEHFSPLMHAAAEGHLEVVRVLIANGADRSLKDVDGDDAASFAAQSGHMHVVEFLNSKEN